MAPPQRCYAFSPTVGYFPRDLHPEEVHEHLAVRSVLRILRRAADMEVDQLRRRVRLPARQLLVGKRVIDAQRLPVAQSLRDPLTLGNLPQGVRKVA